MDSAANTRLPIALAFFSTFVVIFRYGGAIVHNVKNFRSAIEKDRKNKVRSPPILVTSLYIYPIKSCRGIRVQTAKVVKTGFQYDRIFMVIDEEGKFVTQRKISKMALITPKLLPSQGIMEISAPNMPVITVPLQGNSSNDKNNLVRVQVWGDACEGEDMGEEVNNWLTQFLAMPKLRLLRFYDGFTRKTDSKYAPDGQTAFSDGYPFLLFSKESMDALNLKLLKPISQNRFRPNIVVQNVTPFEEDTWDRILFKSKGSDNTMEARVVKPCSRCTIPNVDQETGEKDSEGEVSKALKSFRTGQHLKLEKESWKREVCSSIIVIHVKSHAEEIYVHYIYNYQVFFGQNIDHSAQEGMHISVEDEVTIISLS